MSNVRRLIGVSDWLSFDLETMFLEPPTLRLKVRVVDGLAGLDASGVKYSAIVKEILIASVAEWDLAEDGVPIPCDEENKRRWLPLFFGQRVKGTGRLLGLELAEYAGNEENFLKN
jgi:hypothetical protein